MSLVQKPQLYSALWVLYNSVTPAIVCTIYTLLMTANKPETAVQGCAFFLWGHTHFVFMYMFMLPLSVYEQRMPYIS